MFAAKAKQAIERSQAHLEKSDSIIETIDKWEAAELEKVEAKAKLLGSIFRVDHRLMKDQLLKSRNSMAGNVVDVLVDKHNQAREALRSEIRRKKHEDQENQARRAEEQQQRVLAKLESKFQLIPREEVMKIYEECDRNMEATIDELLYLVALTEAKMRKAKQAKKGKKIKKANSSMKTSHKKKSKKKKGKKKEKSAKEEERLEEEEKEDVDVTTSQEVTSVAVEPQQDVEEEAPEKKEEDEEAEEVEEEEDEKATVMTFLASLSHTDVAAAQAEEAERSKALAISLAREQFDSLDEEEITAVLVQFDFQLSETASAKLLETAENKQVNVLLLAFDREFAEWEIRELLADQDWDVATTTVALNAKLEERKRKRQEEEEQEQKRIHEKAEREREQKEKAAEEEKRKQQAAQRLTLRRVKKTENLGTHFERQMREREAAAPSSQNQRASTSTEGRPQQQQQNFEGARQQLVKNLQDIFNPAMMRGGPPPRRTPPAVPPPRPPRPSEPAPMPPKVSIQLSESQHAAVAAKEATTAPVAAEEVPAEEGREFVDHFLEVRKARVVGARGRRAPSRKPRGAAAKDQAESGPAA